MGSWAVAALCIVSLCVLLSCAVCVWKKCLKKKDKDKEKDKKKGKEKSKGDFDTEMDGGYNKVHTHTHTQSPPADASPLQCVTLGHLEVVKLSTHVTSNGSFAHYSCCSGG